MSDPSRFDHLYRAWDKRKKKLVEVTGIRWTTGGLLAELELQEDGHFTYDLDVLDKNKGAAVLERRTDSMDKNGIWIFEGDIVKVDVLEIIQPPSQLSSQMMIRLAAIDYAARTENSNTVLTVANLRSSAISTRTQSY